MKPLTPPDIASIRVFVTQLFDDNFLFETEICNGILILKIMGKPGAIPDDFAEAIIDELREYHYVGQRIDIPEFGQSVVVKGIEP